MPSNVDLSKDYPLHVAFIMDGNRRWAKKKKLPIIDGHKMGANTIKKIVQKSLKLKIKNLTFFSFSTENWSRSKDEVVQLQTLLKFYLDSETSNFIENKINFSFIGNIERFDEPIRNKLIGLKKLTKKFNNLFFILALSYGSRDEILKAIKKIIRQKKINITEKNISNHLMTKDFPDPDLVIRTSGEKRLSNFLLWQIAYSELYFTKTLWPEFNVNKYMVALNNFVNRKRRYGGD